jgi:hypothetical protein
MGALQSFPEGAVERLAPLLQQAKTKTEYQRLQAVWLRAALGLSAPQIAQALGWQAQSVRQLHSDYLRHGETVLTSQPKGGRHHENLSVPPKYSDPSVIIEVDRLPFAPLVGVADPVQGV